MDRIERSKQKSTELFGNTDFFAFVTDPDFADILNHFISPDKQAPKVKRCMSGYVCERGLPTSWIVKRSELGFHADDGLDEFHPKLKYETKPHTKV